MKIPIFQVDAFTDRLFSGNPAAVCPLTEWLDDTVLQAIAMENNLAETAWFVPVGDEYQIRWFTPAVEVDLCGHATLATAYVLFNLMGVKQDELKFHSRSGVLTVKRVGNLIQMDFPSQSLRPVPVTEEVSNALGRPPVELYDSIYGLAVFRTEEEVASLKPDMRLLWNLDQAGIIATAAGKDSDFVSRFFAPKFGVDEDPVTGSAHCVLAPYWAKKLDKRVLQGQQISARGGRVHCQLREDRVLLSGQGVLYLEGIIHLPD